MAGGGHSRQVSNKRKFKNILADRKGNNFEEVFVRKKSQLEEPVEGGGQDQGDVGGHREKVGRGRKGGGVKPNFG